MPSFKPWKWFNEKQRVETTSRPGLIMEHRRVPDSFIRDQNMMRQKWPAFCAFFYFFTTCVSKTDSAKLNCPFNFAHVPDICIENLVILPRINRSKFLRFSWHHVMIPRLLHPLWKANYPFVLSRTQLKSGLDPPIPLQHKKYSGLFHVISTDV